MNRNDKLASKSLTNLTRPTRVLSIKKEKRPERDKFYDTEMETTEIEGKNSRCRFFEK